MAAASVVENAGRRVRTAHGSAETAIGVDVASGYAMGSRVARVKIAAHVDRFVRSAAEASSLPTKDDDIAFATVAQLSRWIETKQISSDRLTRIYLGRLERFNPKLRCAITITRDLALKQAKQADEEIAGGKYRGPLHGIPWGGKDLLDTAGIPTTYGAEPHRNRVPTEDAAVVKRLHAAGRSWSQSSALVRWR